MQRVLLLAFIMFCYNMIFTQGSDVQFPIGTKWTYDYIDYPGRHEARTFLIYDTLIYNNEVLYQLQSNAPTDVLLKQFDNKVWIVDTLFQFETLLYDFNNTNYKFNFRLKCTEQYDSIANGIMVLDSIIDIIHPFKFSEQMMYYTATIPPNDFYPDSLKVMTRYLKDIGKPEGGPLLPEYFQYYGLCGDALFCLGKLRCFETPDTFIQYSSLPCDTTFLFGNNDCLFSVNTNEHESTEAFEIYPNPVDDILYIMSKQRLDRFFIYDTHGNQILSSPHTLSLKISNLAPGTYLLTAIQHSSQKTFSKLFIKI